jgi:hypothetical protein
MNIEELGRQAIDRIKSQWTLPNSGFLAGGSIANIVWELASGNKAVVNDVDIFIFDGIQEREMEKEKDDSLFSYCEKDDKYYENYRGMCFSSYTKDFYSITESNHDGIFNFIKYKSNTEDPSFIIRSFDINATAIGYSIEKDRIYWTPQFEEFIKSGKMQVCNLMTPSHTAIRIIKKSKDMNVVVDELEFKLLQQALSTKFSDRIKLRFRERYLDIAMCNIDEVLKYFFIGRDIQTEIYVKETYKEDVKLFLLKSNSDDIFSDSNLSRMFKSVDFIFYIRNIYNNKDLKDIWEKVYYFFKDSSYVDREVLKEDIELLDRFTKYAPNSIENIRGYKLSEQIDIIKRFLDKFKEDPIIAISILENVKINKDNIELDDQTALILELSVRTQILNDTNGKVNRILFPNSLDTNPCSEIDLLF